MTHAGAHRGRLGLRLSSRLLMVTWFMVVTWQELIGGICGLEKKDRKINFCIIIFCCK